MKNLKMRLAATLMLLLVIGGIAASYSQLTRITELTADDLLMITDSPGVTPQSRAITAGDARTYFMSGLPALYQPLSPTLSGMASAGSAANKLTYHTGSGTSALTDLSAFGRSLLDDPDSATFRSTIGLALGVDAQAYHANLQSLAGLTTAANRLQYWTGSGASALTDLTPFSRGLLDDVDASAARSTLGALAASSVSAFGLSLADDADAASARSTMGVSSATEVGFKTDVKMKKGQLYTLVFEGDSITEHAATSWPVILCSMVTNQVGLYVNAATSSDTAANMYTTYDSQIAPYEPNTTGNPAWLFHWAGANDLADTAANLYANISNVWRRAKSGGYMVMAFTIPPRGGISAGQELTRVTVNAAILASFDKYDAVFRPDLRMVDPWDPQGVMADDVHPNTWFKRVVGGEIARYIGGDNEVARPGPLYLITTNWPAATITSGTNTIKNTIRFVGHRGAVLGDYTDGYDITVDGAVDNNFYIWDGKYGNYGFYWKRPTYIGDLNIGFGTYPSVPGGGLDVAGGMRLTGNFYAQSNAIYGGSMAMPGNGSGTNMFDLMGHGITNAAFIDLPEGGINDLIGTTQSTNLMTDSITDTVGTGAPDFPNGLTLGGVTRTSWPSGGSGSGLTTNFMVMVPGGTTNIMQFSDGSLTNITADIEPPTISSATVGTDGTTLTIAWSAAATRGSAYNTGDIDVDGSAAGNNLAWTYTSGDGTATWVGSLSATVYSAETLSLDYSGDAQGIEDAQGNDVVAVANGSVVNNSTQSSGQLSTADTDIVAWWDFADATDSHGSFDLTGTGAGPTYNAGPPTTGRSEDAPAAHWSQASVNAAWVATTNNPFAMVMRFQITGDVANGDYLFSGMNALTYIRHLTAGSAIKVANIDVTGEPILSVDTWYLAVMEYNPTNQSASAWVNNSAVTSVTNTASVNTGANFFIGGNATAQDVVVDYVGIFKRVLTSDERTWLYNSGGTRTYADFD